MRPTATLDRTPSTPGELVEQARRSDEAAWRSLVDEFAGLVWWITRTYGLSAADRADVSQTVWLRLVDNLDRLRKPERVGAWLATATRNECLRVSRLQGRCAPTAEPWLLDAVDSVDEDPTVAMARSDRDAAVREVVATLPERSQALLGMLMADPPMSYAQVSAHLSIAIGSIGPTRQRCLEILRAKCIEAGIER